MPFRLAPDATFREALAAADRPLAGMWVCSGSPLVAEICAGSGLDWLLVDAEHSPNGLESILAQLQAVNGYPVTTLVRPPANDTVLIKQYLDLGVQNLLVPMVNTAAEAAAAVAATRYPPHGVRGVGSALARAARWNRIPDYLARAGETISVTVQIESTAAVDAVEDILAVDGVDSIFLGPSDLAASMGLLGEQEHPDVRDAVERCLRAARAAGTPAGVNAFRPDAARGYLEAGASFILVGADVALLARGSEALAAEYTAGGSTGGAPAGY
ncbi:2-dehydro-3-deoxyglucarate aldolase [Arthrobacter crusticola]|uniref:2-dehydro-3-deoxyglucarate aldolase n=1 Tax=Arthrobacter crusticola TaxID=2547960 RepID=A0A4V3AMR7_9MICC|nr:HpcH/HpaI aldolase/citrate lyase family protein [Arthrobacter crusticola]TDK27884.1 2-dehydro-3-deoxyglucarate aldolase [Arthrobacter crusticola]